MIENVEDIERLKPYTWSLVNETMEALGRIYIPTVVINKKGLIENIARAEGALKKMGF